LSEVISPGAVVKDQYGRIGIVVREDSKPSAAWIKEQVHLPDGIEAEAARWWAVAPLTGGMSLTPGLCLSFVRAATYEDFLTAVDHSTQSGRRALAALFPEFTEAVLRGAQ
jgi:hypothetical protein